MASHRHSFFVLLCFLLGGCATVIVDREPETGETNLYESKPVAIETGMASWYRDHRTASGERFNIHAMAAAHKKLPFGTHVRVVDLKTGKSIIVRINDRGPYIRGRIIDLTVGAAEKLGMYHRGIARVRMEVLKEIPLLKKPNLYVPEKMRPKSTPIPSPKPAAVKPKASPSPSPTPRPTATPKGKAKSQATPAATPTPSPTPKAKVVRNRRNP